VHNRKFSNFNSRTNHSRDVGKYLKTKYYLIKSKNNKMKKILFLLISLSTLACNNDDSNPNNNDDDNNNDQTEMLSINLVTGINLRETIDQDPLRLGNPNVFVNNQFSVYPNPASHIIIINSPHTITDIYFISSIPEKIYQNVEFNEVLNSDLYSESTISSQAILELNDQTSSSIDIDVTNLDPGYYKIFIKTNGMFFWDNFYKLDNLIDYNIQIDTISDFWN
jgi:hypothetical protein